MTRAAVLCPVFCLIAVWVSAAPFGESSSRRVTVIGEGSVEATPDIATVRIGVESLDRDVHKALSTSREIIRTIYEALIEMGVADEDMQTANYSFNFDRSSTMDTSRNAGTGKAVYRVNNMLTVTIRNLELTGEIIDAAVLAGANQMWGVEFGVQESSPLVDKATEIAVAAARQRAEHLAGLNGLSVGRLLSISEAEAAFSPALAARSIGGGVHPGVVSHTVRLTAVYELVE